MAPLEPELPDLWPGVFSLTVGGRWPPNPEGASRLIAQCRRHELLPLLARASGLPATVSDALSRHSVTLRLYEERARLFAEARMRLETLLAGERVLFLKGSDYGPRLYRDPGLRPMKDIDVLVPLERFDAVCDRLRAAGVQRVFPGSAATRATSHHERAFAFGGLQVEIHEAFIQRVRHRIDYAGIWGRAVIDEATGRGRLADVDALSYHALAMAADQFQVRLIRYVDLWLLLTRTSATPAQAVVRAREWGAARALYGTLRTLSWLFPAWDGEELAAARRALLSPRRRGFVDRWILPRPPEWGHGRLPPGPVRLWRKLGLLDDWSRRCAFLAYQLRADAEGRRRMRRGPSHTG